MSGAVKTTRIGINAVWNLVGHLTPLLAAYFAIPVLISDLGVERFGLMTMVWFMVGYFSLFDFGLSRALTLLVSEKIGANQYEDIPDVVTTALFAMLVLGLSACGLVYFSSHWLALNLLSVSEAYRGEAIDSISWLALTLPFVILTAGLRGVLEAFQRFDFVNMVRVPLGILTFLTPMFVLPFTKVLSAIVIALMVVRILVFWIHVLLCKRVVPNLFKKIRPSRRYFRSMLSFGGWMTISNVISPLMVYLDRFMIGGVLGLVAVAYYVTPYELVTKILILPASITGVLFPAFSAALMSNRKEAVSLFHSAIRWIVLAVFPAVLVTTVFAREILGFWLSMDFVDQSTGVLQVLSVGILINSLAHLPFAFIQAEGRPDVTAKFHLVELPIYFFGLYIAMSYLGLFGVALAWTVRVTIDAALLFAYTGSRDVALAIRPIKCFGFFILLWSLALGILMEDDIQRFVFGSLCMLFFLVLSWAYLLTKKERRFILNKLYIKPV